MDGTGPVEKMLFEPGLEKFEGARRGTDRSTLQGEEAFTSGQKGVDKNLSVAEGIAQTAWG